MRCETTEKVPQVHGKRLESIALLIEEMLLRGTWGNDKFWMSRNFPGFPGFGIMLRGDDWKGPRRDSISALENGPMYRALSNSVCMQR